MDAKPEKLHVVDPVRAGIKPGTSGRLLVIRATEIEAYNLYTYYSDANGDTSTQTPAGSFLTPSPLFNTILDAHLDERNPMDRLVTFVARLVDPYNGAGCSGGIIVPKESQNLSPAPYGDFVARGIGVGIEAALLVSGDGGSTTLVMAQLVTNPTTTSKNAAYFVLPQNYPRQCADTKPLSGVTAVVVKLDKFKPNFSISTRSGDAPYTHTVANGIMTVLGNGNSACRCWTPFLQTI